MSTTTRTPRLRPHLRRRAVAGVGLAPSDATANDGETRVADQQRDDRRRRRALAAAARAATADPGRDRQARPAATDPQPDRAQPDRATASLSNPLVVRLVAVVAVGLVLGAILGALSVAGWLIGLLVAAATVSLTARSISRGAPERRTD